MSDDHGRSNDEAFVNRSGAEQDGLSSAGSSISGAFSAALDRFPEPPSWTDTSPSSCIADIRTAKLAIADTKERSRQAQRRCRSKHGAFAAGANAVNHPGRITVATPTTLRMYQDRGQALFSRYQREMASGLAMEDLDPSDFVTWLDAVRRFWSETTWRTNLQAAYALIRSIPHHNLEEAIARLHSIRGSLPLAHDPSDETTDETSIASQMPHSDFQKIFAALRLQATTDIVGWTQDWMLAGVSVGLQPDEWRLTEFEQTRFLLHVFNPDVPDTSLAGSYRTVDLSNLSVDTRDAVERLAKRARQWTLDGAFIFHKSQISKLLTKTAATVVPRKRLCYTLDSLHFQFIANMKTVCSAEEISALIGELFINQPAPNYSNQRRDWDCKYFDVPIPSEGDVRRYRRSLAIFEEYRDLRALRELNKRRMKEARQGKRGLAEPEIAVSDGMSTAQDMVKGSTGPAAGSSA